MNILDPTIFREYDIRGIYGKNITEDVYELIGKAFGTLILHNQGKTVSVGRDCRISSTSLLNSLIKGITSTGVNVIDIELVTTPVLYYSLFTHAVDGGAMVTASHNPADYNGLKLCIGKESLFGEGIQKVKQIAEKGIFPKGKGSIETKNILNGYTTYLINNTNLKRPVKLAIDCGNGTVGLTAPKTLKKLGCEVIELYTEPDGTFPNHHPDPTTEDNLKDLKKTVIDNGCELGVAFDGDGDRIGVVDDKANIIWGDMLVLLFAKEILKDNPGAKIIADVKCSSRLFNTIKRYGGIPIMWKTGHSLIKNKMKEQNAILAGEMSGHIFFRDRYFGFDDALYACLRLLEIVSKSNKPLSSMFEDIPPAYSTPEIRIECPEDTKFKIVELVKEKLKNKYEIIDIDGVRIEFPDGWGLIRASNTQPAIVLRFEAQTEKRLQEIRSLIEEELKKAHEELTKK